MRRSMARPTHRGSKGTKLYAVRDKRGKFKDIVSYKRAHGYTSVADRVRQKRAANGNVVANVKASNPKDAIGTLKVGLSNVPMGPLMELAVAMTEGAMKYGRHNYRAIGVRSSVYFDACIRHLAAYWEGEDIDPDSGLPHLAKAMACLTVWRDAQINGKCYDDRPPRSPSVIHQMNVIVKTLAGKFPDPKEPYTEIGKK